MSKKRKKKRKKPNRQPQTAPIKRSLREYVNHYENVNYGTEEQLNHLGLTPEFLGQIDGPILDIGCGSEAKLVRHLRGLGYVAEGIDPLIESDEPYLTRKAVKKLRDIDVPDNHYALVIAHLNNGFTDADDFFIESANQSLVDMGLPAAYRKRAIKEKRSVCYPRARAIFMEALRVGRMFVYYPNVNGFEDVLRRQIPCLSIVNEYVPGGKYMSIAVRQ